MPFLPGNISLGGRLATPLRTKVYSRKIKFCKTVVGCSFSFSFFPPLSVSFEESIRYVRFRLRYRIIRNDSRDEITEGMSILLKTFDGQRRSLVMCGISRMNEESAQVTTVRGRRDDWRTPPLVALSLFHSFSLFFPILELNATTLGTFGRA